MIKIPELLSPAGSVDSAMAAINAGADALYLGGKNFSARASAQNFEDNEIAELIKYAAVRGVRIYIAVNTLYKNHELSLVVDFVCQMHHCGAAAFILQDSGLAYILKTMHPEVEIHASTQMLVHSIAGVHFMEKMGFSRVVLARELSLSEIGEIKAATNIECEVFVHGALCIGYSGQCLMSSLIGGRSGNRGKCAQICRTRFDLRHGSDTIKSGYLLSSKDMCTLDILGEIAATGVESLKIEGRMKSAEYVYLVTKAYRNALNGVRGDVHHKLLQVFNRGGSFCSGYYKSSACIGHMSTTTPKSTGTLAGEVIAFYGGKVKIKFAQDMTPGDGIEVWTSQGPHVGMGISKIIAADSATEFHIKAAKGVVQAGDKVYKSYDKVLIDDIRREMQETQRQRSVFASVSANIGHCLRLSLFAGSVEVEKFGGVVQAAQNAPMSRDAIVEQLSKTGNTPFVLEFEQVDIDDGVFVSKAELNQLRRDALAGLEAGLVEHAMPAIRAAASQSGGDTCMAQGHRHITKCLAGLSRCYVFSNDGMIGKKLTVQISNIDHLQTVQDTGVDRVYVNYNPANIATVMQQKPNTKIFLSLPTISRNTTEAEILSHLYKLETTNISGYLVSTHGQLHLLQSINTKKQIHLNHNFNIFNSHSAQFYTDLGLGITLSQELNIHEIKSIEPPYEIVVYGKQAIMHTHNCPVGLYAKCGSKTNYTLRDKMGYAFPIQTDCSSCIAHILNSKTLDTASKFGQIRHCGAEYYRLVFTTESERQICDTIARYQQAIAGQAIATRLPDSTYGHFFRGAE